MCGCGCACVSVVHVHTARARACCVLRRAARPQVSRGLRLCAIVSPPTVDPPPLTRADADGREASISSEDANRKPLKKRDTPAKLPVVAAKPMSGNRLSVIPGAGEGEEEEWGEEEEEEATPETVTQEGSGEASSVPKAPKGTKRDTPATLPSLPVKKAAAKRLSVIPGEGEGEEEEGWGEDDDEPIPKEVTIAEEDEEAVEAAEVVAPLGSAPAAPRTAAASRASFAPNAAKPAVPDPAATAAARAAAAAALVTWPVTGWLHKQSGGKLYEKKSVGNKLSKWDKRWFVVTEGGGTLAYYKDPKDASRSKAAQGSVTLQGSSVERIGGGDGTFALHTSDRILTLRAESDLEMRGWVRAIVASGGFAEFDLEPTANLKRPSLSKMRTASSLVSVPPVEVRPSSASAVDGGRRRCGGGLLSYSHPSA